MSRQQALERGTDCESSDMIVALKVLHVAVAAAWFGHKLLVPSDLRHSLHSPTNAATLLVRLRRAEALGVGAGLGTLLTGGALVLAIGPNAVRTPVYVGLALVVAAVAVGAVVARPASMRLRETVRDDDLASAREAANRLTTVLVTESVLWSAALVTMLI